MSFTKELLLSCIVLMHVSIMPSQQLDLKKLGNHLKAELPLRNLVNTEQLYTVSLSLSLSLSLCVHILLILHCVLSHVTALALTFLVLMITPATCRNIPQNESLSVTIDFIQKRIQTALHKLGTKQLLLNTPCSHIDVSEPERPFPTGNFGPIFCRTAKMSTKTPEVSDELLSITQSIVDATNGSAPDAGCSLPEFTDDMHKYKYVRCLLLRLDEWLCKAKI